MMTWVPIIAVAGIAGALVLDGLKHRARKRKSAPHSRTDTDGGPVPSRKRVAEAAHAARANGNLDEDVANYVVDLPELVDDIYSGQINTESKYLGRITGNSCAQYGLHDGALFLGDSFGPGVSLERGDFVVVTGQAAHSNVPRRIRRIEAVDNDMVCFSSHSDGKPHKPRPNSSVIAKITHVLA